MQPRPTANYLPTEFLILVGKIAVQSAYADALLGEILGGLKDIKGTERAKTIHCLDTRRKIQDAKPLVERFAYRAGALSATSLIKAR